MAIFGSFKSPAGVRPEYDRLLDIFSAMPIMNGRLVEDVSLSTTATQVSHKLGRAYRGWIITNIDTAATLHVSSETSSDKFITLIASAPCIASLWVF
jgi:type IV secretory pathway ATPase VirB11/archaellum biosynthesis ATPase